MDQRDFERISNALRDLSELVYNLAQEEKERTLKNKRPFSLNELHMLSAAERKLKERKLKQLGININRKDDVQEFNSEFEQIKKVLQLHNKNIKKNGRDEKGSPLFKNDGVLVTQKENYQMIINLPGVSINSKPRKDGRFQGYIMDRNGRTYAYGRTLEEVAIKLKHYLRYGTPRKKKADNTLNGVPTTFTAFSMYYFENFRKKKVAEATYKTDLRRFNRYFATYFADKPLKKITPLECQQLLESLTAQNKGKTADELYGLMSVIFKNAIKHGIMTRNPLDVIYHEKHERISGKALTREEERTLKTALEGTPYLTLCMLALYTGLRPNEYKTAQIDGNFIIAVNSKRKHKHVEYKKIPIIQALKPYLKDGIPNINYEKLRLTYKKVFPDHILYDMRTTFYTRCKEYGVSEHALNAFMGHSLGALGNAYTDLPDEYLLNESKKLDFWQ